MFSLKLLSLILLFPNLCLQATCYHSTHGAPANPATINSLYGTYNRQPMAIEPAVYHAIMRPSLPSHAANMPSFVLGSYAGIAANTITCPKHCRPIEAEMKPLDATHHIGSTTTVKPRAATDMHATGHETTKPIAASNPTTAVTTVHHQTTTAVTTVHHPTTTAVPFVSHQSAATTLAASSPRPTTVTPSHQTSQTTVTPLAVPTTSLAPMTTLAVLSSTATPTTVTPVPVEAETTVSVATVPAIETNSPLVVSSGPVVESSSVASM